MIDPEEQCSPLVAGMRVKSPGGSPLVVKLMWLHLVVGQCHSNQKGCLSEIAYQR